MIWIISALFTALCISIAVNQVLYLRIQDLRRELAEATDWMDPIVIGEEGEDDDP